MSWPACATKRKKKANSSSERDLIVSAIDAAHALARQNPKADLSPVIDALEQIAPLIRRRLKKRTSRRALSPTPSVALDLLKAGEVASSRQLGCRAAPRSQVSRNCRHDARRHSVSVVPTVPSAACSKTQRSADHSVAFEATCRQTMT